MFLNAVGAKRNIPAPTVSPARGAVMSVAASARRNPPVQGRRSGIPSRKNDVNDPAYFPAAYTQTHNISWDDFTAGNSACFNTPPVSSTCEINFNAGGQGVNTLCL
jgi:hypothetical protein